MATRTWNNSAGGDFKDDNSWNAKNHPVAGDTADITSTFSNADYTVAVTDDEAAALINLTAANADLFIDSGGVLNVGSINAMDGTLNVAGTITGGTINFNNNALFLPQGGTLDGETWKGTLALEALGVSDSLVISNGLTVLNAAGNAPGEIDITAGGADLDFEGTQTLNATGGNLAVNIGTSTAQAQDISIGTNALLTLGSAVSVNQIAAGSTVNVLDNGGASGGTIVNNGTMSFTSGTGSGANVTVSNFVNNGTIKLVGGGAPAFSGEDLELTPQVTFKDGATGVINVSDFGFVHINGPNGSVDVSGTILISGTSTVDLDTASVAVSNASGTGAVVVSTGGTININDDYKGSIVFADATGVLSLNQPGNYTGTITGMSSLSPTVVDVIDLLNVSTNEVTGLQRNFTSSVDGTLSVMDNTTTLASFVLLGNYVGQAFGFKADGAGSGTDVFLGCFAAGSRLLTDRGEVAVERLRVGDRMVLARGEATAPIVWLGERVVDCKRHPEPRQVWPVRVAAGAFGPGLPHRDLLLSPDHAVFVNGVLVPVKLLLNGASIVQVRRNRVRYFHVELPEHTVILAEGLAVESYLDFGDRMDFATETGAVRLHPAFDAGLRPDMATLWETRGAAPLVLSGPELTAARAAVARMAMTRAAVARTASAGRLISSG